MNLSSPIRKIVIFSAALTLAFSSALLAAEMESPTPSTTSSTSTATSSSSESLINTVAQVAGDTLNINTATTEQLAKVPGLSSLASAITSYRDSNGLFSSISDLTNIDGIDTSLLEKITPFLSL